MVLGRPLPTGLGKDASERAFREVLLGVRHRDTTASDGMFVLVVGPPNVRQRPAVGLQSGDNVAARHHEKIHTLHTRSTDLHDFLSETLWLPAQSIYNLLGNHVKGNPEVQIPQSLVHAALLAD